ncbi:MAG: N-acetylglucosaminyl-diphospho-decaprenol L-rhamnosyltransferase [Pseudonocardiales bacterium]|jgi:N-acetylglucosaminyl-diphospho-decaprenol L-rhamnosyltransferase|nr:N-acetylglucosaminyl-diphospho-decaprenol L-rhamnosyltransferase [Pseudonocardiales bacterium]MDT7583172.1 N-acetylglucosaminyl-diphospho-decaprenol L-rhamnosyltransferase [Pseudonocardiales bacterium]MDT7672579.1 N-acetylglucosaminyl-diphospho-decaprenol L-rhamnosyltransferase [Pseudonocardiales bacterium]MDT7774068.1 N-acetylglucosaminyl-diphospho-decaprenol L-rhamnosyltransferase [Pseudonocardiales bacterium]
MSQSSGEPPSVEPPPGEPPSYGDQLAVVTVTYSPGDSLTAFLDSLRSATTRPYTVIMADNGSVDGAPERAAAERDGVELLRIGENVGYGSGANRGVAGLGPEVGWVVVANPDLVWTPGSLDELLAAGARTPRAGALGPLIRDPAGAVYPSARMLPSLGRGAGHAVFGTVWPANPWTQAYRQSEACVEERDAEWLSGSCLLLRRAAFDSVGGFDSRYFMYFEDVDLGERLTKAGWRNRYVPSAQVVHTGGHATTANSDISARMLAEHHRSAYRYLADHYPGPGWAPVRLALRAGLGTRSALAVRKASR